jgi:hypothetical protein
VKKVLILAYDFPPYNSIGAHRPWSWYLYFKKFGIEPIVVTRVWDNSIQSPIDYIREPRNNISSKEKTEYGYIYRVPYLPNLRDKILIEFGINRFVLLRKMLSLIYTVLQYYFSRFDTTASIYSKAEEIIQEHKINVIIATSEPFILFKHAYNLSNKFEIPWVADYRDNWTTNTLEYKRGKLNSFLNKTIFKRLELKFLSNASLITTAAPIYKKQLSQLHTNKQIEVILNGYFKESLEIKQSTQSRNNKFIIAYAGLIYGYQPLEEFLDGYSVFLKGLENSNNVELIFYGLDFYEEQFSRVQNKCNQLGILFKSTKRLERNELYEELQNASVFLVFGSPDEERLAAKVFDYILINKKVILFKNDFGILEKIITECNAGKCINSIDKLCLELDNLYEEYLQKGQLIGNAENIDFYSRDNQAKLIVELIKNKVLIP